MENIGFSKEYYIICICLSLFVSITFSSIIYQAIRSIVSQEQSQCKIPKPLLLAIAFWITISSRNFLQSTLLHNLFIPYHKSCINNPTCIQCDLLMSTQVSLFYGEVAIIQLLSIEILTSRFIKQITPSFSVGLKMLKLWVILLCALVVVLNSIKGEYGLEHINNDPSIYICTQTKIPQNLLWQSIIFKIIGLIAPIAIIIIFVSKINELWLKKQKINITQLDAEKLMQDLNDIIRELILLVIMLSLSIIILYISPYVSYMEIISPIQGLLNGFCVCMLFTFGCDIYQQTFGKIHWIILRSIIKKYSIPVKIDNFNRRISIDSQDIE